MPLQSLNRLLAHTQQLYDLLKYITHCNNTIYNTVVILCNLKYNLYPLYKISLSVIPLRKAYYIFYNTLLLLENYTYSGGVISAGLMFKNGCLSDSSAEIRLLGSRANILSISSSAGSGITLHKKIMSLTDTKQNT